VTLVTIHAVIDIATHIGVTEVGSVVIAVATRALEHTVVACIRVASCADPVRVAVIHREVRVIERRARPRRCCVASGAGRREPGGSVVRIGRAVVVALVATHAGRRQRRVVVVHVAISAGHGGVRAGQRESRRVVIEGSAGPVRRAVADIARRRETHRCVLRIICIVVIRLVARNASRVRVGQVVIAIGVATGARDCRMRPRQREAGGGVIEHPVAPVGGGVALVTGLREAGGYVIWIGRALEIFQVALYAGAARQVVGVIYVALRALQRRVRSGQRETGGRVIKCRRCPVRGAMALLAGLRESGSRVRRIVRGLEIVQVAAHAGRVGRREVVVAVYVARRAGHRRMRPGQRESGRRVIERSATPVRGVVALLASLRKVRLHVIRIGSALEVRQVATRARRICRRQVVIAVHVTLHALQGNVRAG